MSIERHFDVPFIGAMALREKQVQQNYRPVIAVHKWFARRPGTLFRGLLLAEFGDRPSREAFFGARAFPGRVVADPFMGGGTPLIEANRVACDVLGWDINPMASLCRLVTPQPAAFEAASARDPDEMTAHTTMARELPGFTDGLATVLHAQTTRRLGCSVN